MKLTNAITSSYVAAANAMRGATKRRRIVAYVESYDDVAFWRTVLSDYEDDTRYFEVMLPTRQTLSKGKKKAIMQMMQEGGGENLIACVDADYDYLIQGQRFTSKEMLSNPYVFHTHVYSIENYQCYAPSLHDICVMATLNDHRVFDFVAYLKLYSTVVFPLFVWNILLYRKDLFHDFTMTDFNHCVEIGNFSLAHPEYSLQKLENKVNVKLRELRRRFSGLKADYEALAAEFGQLGVIPEETYLYIQGHHLADNVVGTLLEHVCKRLRGEREQEIRSKALHHVQYQNELAAYIHSQIDTEMMLKKSTGYTRSRQFKMLQNDIEKFLCANTKTTENSVKKD